MGKGVQKAIDHVNTSLAPQLVGESVFDQRYLDHKMLAADGTENKVNLVPMLSWDAQWRSLVRRRQN